MAEELERAHPDLEVYKNPDGTLRMGYDPNTNDFLSNKLGVQSPTYVPTEDGRQAGASDVSASEKSAFAVRPVSPAFTIDPNRDTNGVNDTKEHRDALEKLQPSDDKKDDGKSHKGE